MNWNNTTNRDRLTQEERKQIEEVRDNLETLAKYFYKNDVALAITSNGSVRARLLAALEEIESALE
jgi:outer membrane receptor for ferric coprogen and ferric-rhodotorulic acid